jgi:tetratricopeptide (TPR) repeat protein
MTVLSRSRFRWGLISALAALTALVVVLVGPGRDGPSPQQSAGVMPFDFRSTAGTPNHELIDGLQQRLRENPRDFDLHINLANAYLQKARETGDQSLYAKVQKLLEEAQKLNGQSPELFAAQGTLALTRHDFAAALESGEQALVLDPDNARYYGIVGDAQIELGMYDEAIASYQDMVDRQPDFGSFSRVSHARELYGDPEGAIEAMEFALQAGSPVPENVAWAYVQLGNLWFDFGNPEEATKAYALSTKTLGAYAPALAGQARLAASRGDLEQAATLYQRAFDRMPLPEYAISLGDVYARMGDPRKAEEQYELVRAIDKLFRANGVNTDLEIALFFADHDIDLGASLEKARAAYEARPSVHAADVLAWTLYKTGDHQEAQQYASEALKLGTRDPLKLFHAGMIARVLGQNEQARAYLQQAVDINPQFSLLYSDGAAAELKDLKAVRNSASGRDE